MCPPQAYHGHAQALEALLQGEKEVDQTDELGRTPLALAALRGHTSCIHTLLSHGASPRRQDVAQGRTPLHLAGELPAVWVWGGHMQALVFAVRVEYFIQTPGKGGGF